MFVFSFVLVILYISVAELCRSRKEPHLLVGAGAALTAPTAPVPIMVLNMVRN
jgi:hypothetical protein